MKENITNEKYATEKKEKMETYIVCDLVKSLKQV